MNTNENPEEIIDGNEDEIVDEGQQGIPDIEKCANWF